MSTELGKAVFFLCCLSSVYNIVCATRASEQESESVELTFYQMTELEWNMTESAFKTLMAAEAVTFCSSNPDCGVAAGFGFTADQVGLYSGPTVESRSLKIKFYIEFPTLHILSLSANTSFVINYATTLYLITSLRTAVESTVGHEITYIEDEFYSIDPDAQLNTIIIPSAFGVLFLMIILMIILHCWSKQKEKAEKKKQKVLAREKRRLKSGRVRPVFTVEKENEGKQSSNFWPRRSRTKRPVKSEMENLRRDDSGFDGKIPTLSMKTNVMTSDLEPANIKPDSSLPTTPLNNNQAVVRNNALPPLPNVPQDNNRKMLEEREKKEKKKQKRLKRQQQESERRRQEAEEEKSSPSEEKFDISMGESSSLPPGV